MRRVADEGRGGAETLLRRERLTLDRLDCFRTVDPFHREVVRVASIKQGPRLTGPLHGAWEGLRLRRGYFFAASAAAAFTSTSTSRSSRAESSGSLLSFGSTVMTKFGFVPEFSSETISAW